jgi:hypothetical protein
VRGLFNRKFCKVTQLNNPTLLRVQLGELVKSSIERQQVHDWSRRGNGRRADGALIKAKSRGSRAALRGPSAPLVINQDPTHELCGDAKKMGAALYRKAFIPGQPQVGFVNESGRLQSVIWTLLSKVIAGHAPQFVIDQWKASFESPAITISPVQG